MSSKDYGIGLLLDFYSELLSPSQRMCLDLYYNEDLSLSEISQNLGISRQGALNNIKKGESILHNYEDKLSLAAQYTKNKSAIAELDVLFSELKEKLPQYSEHIDDIKNKIVTLLS